jgi:threonine-phosphate decarboxylase
VFSKGELELLFQQKPNVTFVIDEAYIEFTTRIESIVSLTSKYQNLIVVRSLTKTFTIPGLRLGYVVSNASNIAKLLKFKMPWSVNLLAIKGGEFILKNYNTLQFNASELLEETAVFKTELSELDGLKVYDSNTSYFLVELLHKTAKELKKYLIEEHQILVRDATNFNGLEGEYIRLSTQSKEANNVLIQILKGWI